MAAHVNPYDKKIDVNKYPSIYGSHATMIDANITTNNYNYVVCKDDEGCYVTERSHLDSGLADPYRYTQNRKKFLDEFVNA